MSPCVTRDAAEVFLPCSNAFFSFDGVSVSFASFGSSRLSIQNWNNPQQQQTLQIDEEDCIDVEVGDVKDRKEFCQKEQMCSLEQARVSISALTITYNYGYRQDDSITGVIFCSCLVVMCLFGTNDSHQFP